MTIISIVEATYLLSARLASFRWHELYSGLFTELGNPDLKSGGRLSRSSDEVSVMGTERRA